MKMTVAVYRNEKYGFKAVTQKSSEKAILADGESVILTEYVEVDFPDLDRGEIVGKQVVAINKEITNERARCESTITRLTKKRNDLLALPNRVSEYG